MITDEQRGKAIMEHIDAICTIMGVNTLSSSATQFQKIIEQQRPVIEKETGEPVDDSVFTKLLDDVSSQVGLAIGATIGAYQDNLKSILNDPDKLKELTKKSIEEVKNGRK